MASSIIMTFHGIPLGLMFKANQHIDLCVLVKLVTLKLSLSHGLYAYPWAYLLNSKGAPLKTLLVAMKAF